MPIEEFEIIIPDKALLLEKFYIESKMRKYRSRPHILIVEDQLFSQKIITQALYKNFTFTTASKPSDAVKTYLKEAPDITLIDIELDGGSGHDVAEAITKIEDDPFLIMVTANYTELDVKRALKNKISGYITKPYTKDKLNFEVNKFWIKNPNRKKEGIVRS